MVVFIQAGEREELRGELARLIDILRVSGVVVVTGVKSLLSQRLLVSGVSTKCLPATSGVVDKAHAWSSRLAEFLNAEAALFLPGNMGVLAHLVPFLAFVVKGEVVKGKAPRRIALLGWGEHQLMVAYAILEQFGHVSQEAASPWFRAFSLDQIEEAVRFLSGTDQ